MAEGDSGTEGGQSSIGESDIINETQSVGENEEEEKEAQGEDSATEIEHHVYSGEKEEDESGKNREKQDEPHQGSKKRKKGRYASAYIDNEAEENDEDDEDDEGDEGDEDGEKGEGDGYGNGDDDNREAQRRSSKMGIKKRRLAKNKYVSTFLDTEAQVGDDEEEEEYASSYVEEFEEAKKMEKKKMYETKLKSGTNHLAQTINKLSQRYENEKDAKDTLSDGETLTDEEMSVDEEYFDEGECLSTFDSPKMWLIKLFKNGVERNLAMGIYYKYMKLKDNDFNIKGIYVSDNLKGYIYIEADSLYMLKRFLLGFKFINLNEISIVPVQELTSIFAMCHSKVIIPKVNEYVRIKRGVYTNDIGQIFEVHEKGIYAIVRLIPRIVYDKYHGTRTDPYSNGIASGTNNNVNIHNGEIINNTSGAVSSSPSVPIISVLRGQVPIQEENGTKIDTLYALDKFESNSNINNVGNRNINFVGDKIDILDEALQIRRKKKKERPLKKFFDRDEIEQIGGVIEHGPYPRTIKYQNHIFEENGYLLKKMNIKYLVSENANITLTEIRDFNKNNTNEDDLNLHLSKSFINKNSLHLFKKGERVKIMKGELYNLIGTITSVNENVLTINPDNLAKNFKFQPTDVTKYFIEGDNVTVINGLHKGKSGLISLLDYKENVALIFSPALNTEFRSSIQDLTGITSNSSEGLGGVNTLNGFSIGDLIELNDRQIGVLTYIDKNKHIRVLTHNNNILHTTIGAITSKRSAIGQVCKDENGNIIQAKDTIQLVRGIYKNKIAIVNYIWKNKIFAKIGKKIEDNGFVVIDCENCILSGNNNEKKKIITHNNLFRNNTYTRQNNFHSFIGKTVKILSGVYKGLLGDVINAERDEFTLLLKIKPKTIRQKRIECAIADSYKDHPFFEDKFYNNENGVMMDHNSRKRDKFEKNERNEKINYDYYPSFYTDIYQRGRDNRRKNNFGEKNEDSYYTSNDRIHNYHYGERKNKNLEISGRNNLGDDGGGGNFGRGDTRKPRRRSEENGSRRSEEIGSRRSEEDILRKGKKEENKKYGKKRDQLDDVMGDINSSHPPYFDEETKRDKRGDKNSTQLSRLNGKKGEESTTALVHSSSKEHDGESVTWLLPGIVIKIVTPGPFYNEIGRIMEIIKKDAYTILKIETEKISFSIVSDAVVPLKPSKRDDEVVILEKGKLSEGTVIDIQNNQVHVNTALGNVESHIKNVFMYKRLPS
ncbi:transcription elongation factor SPT5, putative [Plasmodium ovale]|uniref:Transcription elongation factor SPT5 n=1 Tax=Plasmodium ovale TaxID=36330 RepID=A0A1D3TJV4_PLAOA|nr:transcription elongation factor SPT5, putative [Plasmodium ovale]